MGPTNYKCNCPANESGVSRTAVGSGWCSSITVGVPSAMMAETLDSIKIEFGVKIDLKDQKLDKTWDLC